MCVRRGQIFNDLIYAHKNKHKHRTSNCKEEDPELESLAFHREWINLQLPFIQLLKAMKC